MNSDNPYSTPQSTVASYQNDGVNTMIESLQVSEKWKAKFRAIALAGGPKMPNLKSLPKDERRRAFSFNILAFLFGPFYYIAKGMWKRGLVLFFLLVILVFIVAFILEYFGLSKVANALGYGVSAVFAIRANIDYYKKMVLDDNGWI